MLSTARANKVLLINPSGWVRDNVNLGLCYLSSALKAAGFEAPILELNLYPMGDESLVEAVKAIKPTVIGISVKTATANEGGRLASLFAKHFPEAVLLAGGPHVTIAAEAYLTTFEAFHYAAMSEAEISIVEILNALEEGRPVSAVPGVVHRQAGKVVVNSWTPPPKLDELTLPDFSAVIGFDWKSGMFQYPILSSRGCPYECIFCCVPDLTGSRKWRSRSVKSFVDEMEFALREGGVRHFELWDDNFTLHLPRAKQICREIIARGLDITWACHNGIRADRIDEELALLMSQAGCVRVAFGIESGNASTFDRLKKGEPLKAVVDAVNIVRKAGIDAIGYFIIGLPGDDLQKFIETIRFQRSLGLRDHRFGMLVPYPKTEIWDIVQREGRMLSDITKSVHYYPNDDVAPITFETPGFPKEDMERAYFISRAFPLYDFTTRAKEEGRRSFVVYLASSELAPYLPGFLRASEPSTTHVVVGRSASEREALLAKVGTGASIEFHDCVPVGLPEDSALFVCDSAHLFQPSEYHSRAPFFLFSPENSVLLEERCDPEGRVVVGREDLRLLAEQLRASGATPPAFLTGATSEVSELLEIWRREGVDVSRLDIFYGRELLLAERGDVALEGFDGVEQSGERAWRWAMGLRQRASFPPFSGCRNRVRYAFQLPVAGSELIVRMGGRELAKACSPARSDLHIEGVFDFSSEEFPGLAELEFEVVGLEGKAGVSATDSRPLSYNVLRFELSKVPEAGLYPDPFPSSRKHIARAWMEKQGATC
ncbi:MAG TPA: radical SAM protein [Bdellovibrionota bacterium]|jgi:radical SAM superfamily enzyme YgiQ (UPF0313 family)